MTHRGPEKCSAVVFFLSGRHFPFLPLPSPPRPPRPPALQDVGESLQRSCLQTYIPSSSTTLKTTTSSISPSRVHGHIAVLNHRRSLAPPETCTTRIGTPQVWEGRQVGLGAEERKCKGFGTKQHCAWRKQHALDWRTHARLSSETL